jgi:hypothetical protein
MRSATRRRCVVGGALTVAVGVAAHWRVWRVVTGLLAVEAVPEIPGIPDVGGGTGFPGTGGGSVTQIDFGASLDDLNVLVNKVYAVISAGVGAVLGFLGGSSGVNAELDALGRGVYTALSVAEVAVQVATNAAARVAGLAYATSTQIPWQVQAEIQDAVQRADNQFYELSGGLGFAEGRIDALYRYFDDFKNGIGDELTGIEQTIQHLDLGSLTAPLAAKLDTLTGYVTGEVVPLLEGQIVGNAQTIARVAAESAQCCAADQQWRDTTGQPAADLLAKAKGWMDWFANHDIAQYLALLALLEGEHAGDLIDMITTFLAGAGKDAESAVLDFLG